MGRHEGSSPPANRSFQAPTRPTNRRTRARLTYDHYVSHGILLPHLRTVPAVTCARDMENYTALSSWSNPPIPNSPLNWYSHSLAANTCPMARALTAFGASMHSCFCGGDRPGIRLHSNVAEKHDTILKCGKDFARETCLPINYISVYRRKSSSDCSSVRAEWPGLLAGQQNELIRQQIR